MLKALNAILNLLDSNTWLRWSSSFPRLSIPWTYMPNILGSILHEGNWICGSFGWDNTFKRRLWIQQHYHIDLWLMDSNSIYNHLKNFSVWPWAVYYWFIDSVCKRRLVHIGQGDGCSTCRVLPRTQGPWEIHWCVSCILIIWECCHLCTSVVWIVH